jgi:hypothetical protein
MSSETSTNKVRLKPDTTDDAVGKVRLKPDTTDGVVGKVRLRSDTTDGGVGHSGSVRLQPDPSDAGLQPWQFFVLAALGCATAVTFMARGQGPTAVILLGVLMATAALVGYAMLRTLRPLVLPEEDRTVMVGQRTRVALEREKLLTLRSIKELEFDRAMGRLSDEDWNEMSGRLRARAARLMRQLDAGAGYREQIEKDLAKRIEGDARLKPSRYDGRETGSAKALAERVCASCDTANDADAKFCKGCGQPLVAG